MFTRRVIVVFARSVVVTAAIVAAAPSLAEAQGYVGLGGGLTLPTGPTARSNAIGWNGLAFLGFGAPDIPLGIRFDGLFTRLQYKDKGPYENIYSGTANLVAPLSQTGTLVPYLIGGLGYYEIQRPGELPGTTIYPYGASTGALGLNGGLGIRTWSGNKFGLFLEARFHYVFSRKPAQPFVPLTLGFTF
jgi:Outer membrane protein beta-barrel domain